MAILPTEEMCNALSTPPYRCGRCEQAFTTSRARLRHLRESKCGHSDVSRVQKKYKCTKCPDTFSRDYDRRRHERRRHGNNNRFFILRRNSQQIDHIDAQRYGFQSRGEADANSDAQTEDSPDSLRTADTPPIELNERKRSHGEMSRDVSVDADISGLESLSLSGSKASYRRNPLEHKPILCTICRQPFDTNNIRQLNSHLNDHFRSFHAENRCNECGINFIQKADLDRHRISAARGYCGFQFHHSEVCTGHHPPGEDHIKLWDRIRHWQQCQLQSYIDKVEELSKRPLSGRRYMETENNNTCRGCRILDFYHCRFPDEYWAIYNKHLKEHSRLGDAEAKQCCHADMTETATEELLLKLTSRQRRRRASSADVEHVRKDVRPLQRLDAPSGCQSPATTIEQDATEILDASYLSNPLQGLFHWAACAGDLATITGCKLNGANVHGADMSGRTALHYAAASGSCAAVELLLSYEAKTELADHAGQTPLFLAVECGNSDVVQLLLESGANPNATDKMPQSCLHLAAEAGDATVIEQLLSHGALVDNADCFERTPLHLAAKFGHLDAVQALCKAQASVELRDHAARTPLCLAVENDNVDIVRSLLVHHGALVSSDVFDKAIERGASDDLLELIRSGIATAEPEHDRDIETDSRRTQSR